MKTAFCSLLLVGVALVLVPGAVAQTPTVLPYQGRLSLGGVNPTGAVELRFALVTGEAGVVVWASSAVSPDGVPWEAVSVPVVNGLFAVRLGDASLANMAAMFVETFDTFPDLRLRIWASWDGQPPQLLAPDVPLSPPPVAQLATTVRDGAIVAAKLGVEAVGAAHLAPQAVQSMHLAPGAVGAASLAPGAVSGDKLAAGAVEAGALHPDLGFDEFGSVAVWANGSLWLFPEAGLLPPPLPPGRHYVQVAAGPIGHLLALRSDGVVVGWGPDPEGATQIPPAAPGTYTAIAAGSYHSVALRADGTIVGAGTPASAYTFPPAPGGYVAIAAGSSFSLALTGTGQLVAVGENHFGETMPPPPPAGTTYVGVAAGVNHGLAWRSDGELVAWGRSAEGQTSVPPLPPGLTYTGAAGGSMHSVALRSDGSVVAWGGEFFLGTEHLAVPPVPSGLHYTAVGAGNAQSYALRSDGRLLRWGQLSSGATAPPTARVTAFSTAGARGVAVSSAGFRTQGTLSVAALHSQVQMTVGWPAGAPLRGMLGVRGRVVIDQGELVLRRSGQDVATWSTNTAGPSPFLFVAMGNHATLGVHANGRVGIGSGVYSNPDAPLDVSGRIRSVGGGVGDTAGLRLAYWDGFAAVDRAFVGLRDANAAGIFSNSAWNLLVHSNGSTVLGASTEGASPHRLDVNGSARVRGDFVLNGRGGGWGNSGGAGRALVDGGPASGPDSVAGGGLFINFSNDFGRVVIGSNVTVLGTVTQISDAALKRDIAPLPDPREKLAALRGVSFTWAEPAVYGAGRQIGLLAQEVEAVFPELVATAADGTKAVAYPNLVPVLLEALKAQQRQIDALAAALAELRAAVSAP
jgi:hypothetical protein